MQFFVKYVKYSIDGFSEENIPFNIFFFEGNYLTLQLEKMLPNSV